METPMELADFMPPEELEDVGNVDAMQNNDAVPIRSWDNGSPLVTDGPITKMVFENPNELLNYGDLLEDIFHSNGFEDGVDDFTQYNDGEDDEEGDQDYSEGASESGEDEEEDEDDYSEDYEGEQQHLQGNNELLETFKNFIVNESSAERYAQEVEEDEENYKGLGDYIEAPPDEYEYDDHDHDNDDSPIQYSPKVRTPREKKIQHTNSMESQEGDDLMDIMNGYSELFSYLSSPRKNPSEPHLHTEDTRSAQLEQVDAVDQLLDNLESAVDRFSRSKLFQEVEQTVQQQKKGGKKKKSKEGVEKKGKPRKLQKRVKPVNTFFPSGVPTNAEAGSKVVAPKLSMSEVEEKHKAMLNKMSEQRKEQKEKLEAEEMKAKAKRDKFKQALVEKARLNKQSKLTTESETDDPSAAPSDKQKPLTNKNLTSNAPQGGEPGEAVSRISKIKTAAEVLQSDQEVTQSDEQRREYVAAIRRKFKEQHKKILLSLKMKNKEQVKKTEDSVLREQQKREKQKKKLERLLQDRQPTKTHSENEQNPEEQTEPNSDPSHKTPSARLTSSSAPPAGSALAAVRKRGGRSFAVASKSTAAIDAVQPRAPKPIESEEVKTEEEQEREKQLALKRQRIAEKARKAKVALYLATLIEQKKAEETAARRNEERRKKRMELLRDRLLLEATERKLMSVHDKHQYSLAQKPNEKVSDPVKPRLPKPKPAAPKPSVTEDKSGLSVQPPKAGDSEGKRKAGPGKISSEAAETLSNRLYSHQTKTEQPTDGAVTGGAPPARDFADWKRKSGVPAEGKVFCMTGWYPCVKQALLDRGWFFNPDPASAFFHLKWTLRSLDISQDNLQPWQLTNHYMKNVAITTKAGLVKSLQSLVWLADVTGHDIIPRGFDLSTPQEMQAFIEDFQCQRAAGLLMKLYVRVTGLNALPVGLSTTASGGSEGEKGNKTLGEKREKVVESGKEASEEEEEGSKPEHSESDDDDADHDNDLEHSRDLDLPPVPPSQPGLTLSEVKVNRAVFDAACSVLERFLSPWDEAFLDRSTDINAPPGGRLVSDLEWELLSQFSMDRSDLPLSEEPPEPVDLFLRDKFDPVTGTATSGPKPTPAQLKERRRLQRVEQDARLEAGEDVLVMRGLEAMDLARIHELLCRLRQQQGSRQFGLSGWGEQAQNLWIVKPAAKSRGRGISTFADLGKLLKYTDAGSGLSTQWVVQKYMENPLTIAKRKFDMRQWVLVTNWNPLTVHFFDEFYARFSVEEYSVSEEDLENSFVHLVNNSIGKNSENFNKKVTAENGVDIDGYMWGYDTFSQYLKDTFNHPEDIVKTKIQPRMKDIVKWSLMCASEMIEHRKNSWELYGFDFMVDSDFNAWLIEINSSPACDYSTSVTERYVQKALVELLSVVLDVREWEGAKKKSGEPKPDTGGWELIYQGPLFDMPAGSFGTDMTLKGEGLKGPPVRRNAPLVPSCATAMSKTVSDSDSPLIGVSGTQSTQHHPSQHGRGLAQKPSRRSSGSAKEGVITGDKVIPSNVGSTGGPRGRRRSGVGKTKEGPEGPAVAAVSFDDSDDEKTAGPPDAPVGEQELSNGLVESDVRDHLVERKAGLAGQQGTGPSKAVPIKVFTVDF